MTRDPLDRYYTPPELALELTAWLCEVGVDPHLVFEPSAGLGAFVDAAHEVWPDADVRANDVFMGETPGSVWSYEDFLAPGWGFHEVDLVLGNPPFKLAEQFVDRALSIAPRVAFLLPLAFLAGQKRATMHARWPLRRVWVLSGRPAFTGPAVNGKQTATTDYAFYLWDLDHAGPPTIGWV